MSKLKEAFDVAEKFLLERFEIDGNVVASEVTRCGKISTYSVFDVRKRKLDLLKENWDLFAGDYACDPKRGFPEEEMQERVNKDVPLLRTVWDNFVKEVDDLMDAFIRRDSETWWRCRQFIWKGETVAKYVSGNCFEDIKSAGDLTMDFSQTQLISLSVTDWGFIINCISKDDESMMLCFAKVGSKDMESGD